MAVTHPLAPAAIGRRAAEPADAWSETRAATALATRLASDKDDYLAGGAAEVGRRVSAVQHELFVVCDPAEALQQRLEHVRTDYIAIHDVGATASLSMLGAVAEALARPLQRLVIRRQGFGTTLASLVFVELPATRGRPALRLYGTSCADADPDQRRQLAEVLLRHCRLGVVLVAARDSPAAVERELRVLADALGGVDNGSRQLLCIPFDARAATLAASSELMQREDLRTLLGPPCARPPQAWTLVQDVWSQMRAGRDPVLAPVAVPAAEVPAGATAIGAPPAAPARARAPAPSASVSASGSPAEWWSQRLRACTAFDGLVSACVFERASLRTLAHAGTRPGPASLATHAAALIEAGVRASSALGLPRPQTDISVGCEQHIILVRPIEGFPELVVIAVLDARTADAAQARRRLDGLGSGCAG